jgi:riboflavin synthase
MFTGIIQGLGSLQSLTGDRLAVSLTQGTAAILADLAVGDSVAVDGVCLTVEDILSDGFLATASPETLQRTTLSQRRQAAALVNIETSLRAGSKLGGHFVTGHVDGIGCLVESLPTERAWEMTFAAPPSLRDQWQQYLAPYLVQKGSVAVNGISLTVADWGDGGSWFLVAVIPHTYQETNLRYLKVGDWVNIEGDILGKYVERLLNFPAAANSPAAQPISLSFLAEHGYLE